MIINISVVGKRPAVNGTPIIVCGNSDYIIKFTFDDEWEELPVKTARFIYVQTGEVKCEDVPFEGDTVQVPILTKTREVRIGVFAGDLHTSTPAVIPCELSVRCLAGAVPDPTPSQYDEIMALIQKLSAGIEGLDSELSVTSPNPVQNSAITRALNEKANVADLASFATIEYVYQAIRSAQLSGGSSVIVPNAEEVAY